MLMRITYEFASQENLEVTVFLVLTDAAVISNFHRNEKKSSITFYHNWQMMCDQWYYRLLLLIENDNSRLNRIGPCRITVFLLGLWHTWYCVECSILCVFSLRWLSSKYQTTLYRLRLYKGTTQRGAEES